MILSELINEGIKYLRPGELTGSYTDAQMKSLGFKKTSSGVWYIDQRRWDQLTHPKSGTKSIQENIQPEITNGEGFDVRVDHAGFTIQMTANGIGLVQVRAFRDGKKVGEAWFEATDDGSALVSSDITVPQQYQRQGVATAIYQALKNLGNAILPSQRQTPDGAAMWKGFVKNQSLDEQNIVHDDIDENATPIQERVSKTLYHYTSLWPGLQILKSGKFGLSSSLGTELEHTFAPKGYPYFISTTRTVTGGYHEYVGSGGVMFVLDGDWFNQRYPGKAVDYWGNRDPEKLHHKRHEAEDRIFSRKPTMPIDGVKSIHVFVKDQAENRYIAMARKLIIIAKVRKIPVYFYDDESAWRGLDTRRTASVTKLRGSDDSMSRTSRHRGYLVPWIELIFGHDESSLSRRASQLLYSLKYHQPSEAHQGLAADLSNARKPDAGRDREYAIKIIEFMRRQRLSSLMDLLHWIRDRWSKKPNDMKENFADGRKPGRKGLSRRVGIPKKATLAQLEKIAGSSTGERRRMAQWQLNMRRGKNK